MPSALSRYFHQCDRPTILRHLLGLVVLLAVPGWCGVRIWSAITHGDPTIKEAGELGVVGLFFIGMAALAIYGLLFAQPKFRQRAAAGDPVAIRALAAGERTVLNIGQSRQSRLAGMTKAAPWLVLAMLAGMTNRPVLILIAIPLLIVGLSVFALETLRRRVAIDRAEATGNGDVGPSP
jgi:hypothetical protein